MTRHLIFLAYLMLSSAYAICKGGGPEKIGSVSLLAGALLSVWVARPLGLRFHTVEAGVLLTDLTLLGIFIWLSLRSTRFWPIWLAALLGAEVTVHFALLVAPGIVPEAYMDAVALWSWVAQAILIIATLRHRQRLTQEGVDAPWKM